MSIEDLEDDDDEEEIVEEEDRVIVKKDLSIKGEDVEIVYEDDFEEIPGRSSSSSSILTLSQNPIPIISSSQSFPATTSLSSENLIVPDSSTKQFQADAVRNSASTAEDYEPDFEDPVASSVEILSKNNNTNNNNNNNNNNIKLKPINEQISSPLSPSSSSDSTIKKPAPLQSFENFVDDLDDDEEEEDDDDDDEREEEGKIIQKGGYGAKNKKFDEEKSNLNMKEAATKTATFEDFLKEDSSEEDFSETSLNKKETNQVQQASYEEVKAKPAIAPFQGELIPESKDVLPVMGVQRTESIKIDLPALPYVEREFHSVRSSASLRTVEREFIQKASLAAPVRTASILPLAATVLHSSQKRIHAFSEREIQCDPFFQHNFTKSSFKTQFHSTKPAISSEENKVLELVFHLVVGSLLFFLL